MGILIANHTCVYIHPLSLLVMQLALLHCIQQIPNIERPTNSETYGEKPPKSCVIYQVC